MSQNLDEDGNVAQAKPYELALEYIQQITWIAYDTLFDVWSLILSLSFQGQFLLALCCWLVINIFAIHIGWKVFGPVIFNPKIPGNE